MAPAAGAPSLRPAAENATASSLTSSSGSTGGSLGDSIQNGRERLVRNRLRWLEGNWDGKPPPSYMSSSSLLPGRHRRRRKYREPNAEHIGDVIRCVGQRRNEDADQGNTVPHMKVTRQKHRELGRDRNSINVAKLTSNVDGEHADDNSLARDETSGGNGEAAPCHGGAAQSTTRNGDADTRSDYYIARRRLVSRPVGVYVSPNGHGESNVDEFSSTIAKEVIAAPKAERGEYEGDVEPTSPALSASSTHSSSSSSSSRTSTSSGSDCIGSALQSLVMVDDGNVSTSSSCVLRIGSHDGDANSQRHPNAVIQSESVVCMFSPRRRSPPYSGSRAAGAQNLTTIDITANHFARGFSTASTTDSDDSVDNGTRKETAPWQARDLSASSRARERASLHERVLKEEDELASVRQGKGEEGMRAVAPPSSASGADDAEKTAEYTLEKIRTRFDDADDTAVVSPASRSTTSNLHFENACVASSAGDWPTGTKAVPTTSGGRVVNRERILLPFPHVSNQNSQELADRSVEKDATDAGGSIKTASTSSSTAAIEAARGLSSKRDLFIAKQRAYRLEEKLEALNDELRVAVMRQTAADATAVALMDRARAAELSRDVKEIQIRNLEVRLARATDELARCGGENELSNGTEKRGQGRGAVPYGQERAEPASRQDPPHVAERSWCRRKCDGSSTNSDGMPPSPHSEYECIHVAQVDFADSDRMKATEKTTMWEARLKKFEGQLREGLEGIGVTALRASGSIGAATAAAEPAKIRSNESGSGLDQKVEADEETLGLRKSAPALATSGSMEDDSKAGTFGQLDEYWGSDYCTSA